MTFLNEMYSYKCDVCHREDWYTFNRHFANGSICKGNVLKYTWLRIGVR